ncbi:MAG: hypothetical protein K8R68_07155 [Bacteroidales bacterium]|nr:hypothetical protein [Bacteroidales bacterium]
MIKLVNFIFRIIWKFLFFVLLSVIIIIVIEYIICPVYQFQLNEPFSGNKYYNPYEDVDELNWYKANFQVQSYAWKGITAGRGNTNERIYEVYQSLGYDIIATSDYQKINKYRCESPSYIPVYEHGYGIKKNHQVLLGAERVLWTDYTLFQSIHNKQHVLNLLRKDNELIYIAHPKLRNGYSIEDMKLLANYDGIEVLNNFTNSFDHWDAALSSGNYITIIGNDDAHDVSNPNEIGHHCTFISAPTSDRRDILNALKVGKSFGARIYRPYNETFDEKIKRTKVLPIIKIVEINKDSLNIHIDSLAKEIRFIGQNGELLKSVFQANKAFYIIKSKDTYIRTEIEFPDQTAYFLNPVCRYDGSKPGKASIPEINVYKTNILRIIGFATIIFLFINFIFLRLKPRKR